MGYLVCAAVLAPSSERHPNPPYPATIDTCLGCMDDVWVSLQAGLELPRPLSPICPTCATTSHAHALDDPDTVIDFGGGQRDTVQVQAQAQARYHSGFKPSWRERRRYRKSL